MKIPAPTIVLLTGAVLAVALLVASRNANVASQVGTIGLPGPAYTAADGSAAAEATKPPKEKPKATPTRSGKASIKPKARPPEVAAGTLVAVPGTARLRGDADDWDAAATMKSTETVSGRDTGVSASWQLMWDRSNLYLRATVRDANIVQPFAGSPGQLFRGDSVSLELGADASKLSNQAGLRAGDAHYLFGPRPGGGLVTAVNRVRSGTFTDGRADSRIRTFERSTGSGYLVEMAIPWSVVGVTPASGRELAANLNVSDGSQNGDLRCMKSTNSRRTSSGQSHPGVWQSLTLQG